MMARVLVVQGHPDIRGSHLCRRLVQAYICGAEGCGHRVRLIDVARLDFPVLTSKRDWLRAEVPDAISRAQEDLKWAEHVLVVFPLWFGDMPALLKAFLEQVLRPGFAFADEHDELWEPLLSGKTARIVATANMPIQFRTFDTAGDASLEDNVLAAVGIDPRDVTVVDNADVISQAEQNIWAAKMHEYGSLAG
jgi:putative NADPH-quinone reductase